MIKKIHYVWFGGQELPSSVRSCISTWRRFCPDWEIIQWNETNFDCSSYPWVREALEAKKYAFAADFVRLWVLKNEGGAYMDTDVQVLRPLDDSIKGDFVCGILVPHLVSEEAIYNRMSIQTGFLYSEPNHPFILKALESIYDNGERHFVNQDGSFAMTPIDIELMSVLLKNFDAVLENQTQHLANNTLLYDSSVFATRKSKNSNSYLIHWFDQTWTESNGIKDKLKKFIKKQFYFLYRLQ